MTINGKYYGNHNVYEDENGVILFHLNRMLGSRDKAIALSSILPDRLDGKIIEIIGTDSVGATQPFIDEFCNQLVIERHASKVRFVDVPEKFKEHAESSGIMNGFFDKLSFETRNPRI